MGVVRHRAALLLFGIAGGPLLIALFVFLNYYDEGFVANLSLLGYFIISAVLVVKLGPHESFSLPIKTGRVLAVLLIEIGIGFLFALTYAILRLDLLTDTILAIGFNFIVLTFVLGLAGPVKSLFRRVGLVFGAEFKYYLFTIAVPLSLVFGPSGLQVLQQVTTPLALIVVVNTALLAPFVEELVFRGLVFRKMVSNGFGLHKSMLVSTLLFTFSHWNIILAARYSSLASPAALGVVNCYLYFYTKRLSYPMIFHMLLNLA